jgi:uncharacterized protein
MIKFISQPWPWFVSGPAIAFVMLLLIYFGNTFGFSSNLKNICAMFGAGKYVKYFSIDWKKQSWNLYFLVGSVIGGFIAAHWLKSPMPIQISNDTIDDLQKLNISFDGRLEPGTIFSFHNLMSAKGVLLFLEGGFLIGFGTRYAGGCTSGHAISGLSNLQWPSLTAVIGFFIGGLIMTHLLFPIIFN